MVTPGAIDPRPVLKSGCLPRPFMTLDLALIDFFRWATLAGMVLTCLRLLRCRLHRRYSVFFAFLLFSSVRTAVLLVFPTNTSGYMKIWVLTEPVLWVFYILLVLELYSLILEDHKGLHTLGRWAMYAASATSAPGFRCQPVRPYRRHSAEVPPDAVLPHDGARPAASACCFSCSCCWPFCPGIRLPSRATSSSIASFTRFSS